VRVDGPAFVDECTVVVRGGDGGNGSVSFRREAHVPRGGPDGGDGGRGGDVVLVADPGVTSLLDLRRRPHLSAIKGAHGAGMGRTGADGEDLVVRVPLGTLVRDADTGDVLADLVLPGQTYVAGPGGRAGRGNVSLSNRHRRVPTFAERGERTRERRLALELKVIADVGLVGFPSAGKSSLVRQLSSATPRVEAWPFTTLTPHLGVMRGGETDDGTPIDVVIADVPGLIEGAADGKGLGIQFLRHVERCSVLVHVLDCAPAEPERDPIRDLAVIRRELERHDPTLLARREVLVLTKVDLPDGRAMAELVRGEFGDDVETFAVSSLTGEGLDALRYRLAAIVAEYRAARDDVVVIATGAVASTLDDAVVVLRPQPRGTDVEVSRVDDGAFRVVGERIERWVQMLPIEDRGALRSLQGRLRRAGVERALVAAGARSGDDVIIGESVFSFDPELADLPAEEREALLAGEAEAEAELAEALEGAVDEFVDGWDDDGAGDGAVDEVGTVTEPRP
jgi:GTP-binding protein